MLIYFSKWQWWHTRFYVMPLEQAQKMGNPTIIALLIKAGAKSASECFEADNAERRLLESLAPLMRAKISY